jgi:hypothetical protein
MSMSKPDFERDVIVRPMKADPERGDQWAVFVGSDKRVELSNQQGAMVFARLLADVQQRRVWICHDASGDLTPLDYHQLGGCACC